MICCKEIIVKYYLVIFDFMAKTCFIISSIGEKESEVRILADLKFDLVFEPVLKEFDYVVTRADMIGSPSSISYDIVNHVLNSDLAIADISDSNPNVFYELAMRNACQKPVILIKGIDQKMPFDIYDKRAIPLEMSNARQWIEAKEELKIQVKNADSDPDTASKSILTGYIKINPKKDLTSTDEINLQLKDLMLEVRRIREEVSRSSRRVSTSASMEAMRERRKQEIMRIIYDLNDHHNLPIPRMQLVNIIRVSNGMPENVAMVYLKRLLDNREIVENEEGLIVLPQMQKFDDSHGIE